MSNISFAIPKGSLEKSTLKFLKEAGYKITGAERSYRPKTNDKNIGIKILRPQEIPLLIAEGYHDIGITGIDWLNETNANVELLQKLEYGTVKIILAVPKSLTSVNSIDDLLEINKNKKVRIATEYLNLTSKYLLSNKTYQALYGSDDPMMITPWWSKGKNKNVCLYLSFGATEAKPPEEAEAIIDNTETGTTLDINNLKIIDKILVSNAVLIANKSALKDNKKREKILDVCALLKGVVEARTKIHIFLNIKEENLKKLLSELPSLKAPTISPLSEKGWFSINTVIAQDHFIQILPVLRKLSQGVVVYQPRQVMSLEKLNNDENDNKKDN